MQGLASQHDAFTPTFAREALITLRDLGRGAIVVTCGSRDLRLVRDGDALTLEAAGFALPRPGDGRDLVRTFLCALFWEDPTVTIDPAGAARPPAPMAIRLTKGAGETIEQLEQGVAELESLRELVPGLDVAVSVTGSPPPPTEDSPTAKLFRALHGQPPGPLGAVAEKVGLDAIDAAWAVADLLEVKQAIVKRPPPTVGVRRLKRSEALFEEGLLPPMRLVHAARGLARIEPKRSAIVMQLAGEAFLQHELPEHASACLKLAVTGAPENVAARESLVLALEASNRQAEATIARAELARLHAELRLWRRARAHLEALPELTPDQRGALLDARLAAGDFTAAAELALDLAPGWPEERRRELPHRFAQAGATGDPLAAVVTVSGLQRLLPARRLVLVACILMIVLAAALGAELELRTQFAAAQRLSREHLEAGRDADADEAWQPLAALAQRVGATRSSFTCLGAIEGVRKDLADIAADRALLAQTEQLFVWQASVDTLEAERELAVLLKQVRSDALRPHVTLAQSELDAYRKNVAAAVERLQSLTQAGRSDDALTVAHQLVTDHGNARDLWADKSVEVRLDVLPKDANVKWRGELASPLTREGGRFHLQVPLDGSACELVVSYPNHVSQQRTVRFADLLTAQLGVELVRLVQDPALAWPEAPAAAKLHVIEDARGAQLARQHLRQDATFESSEPAFAALGAALPAGKRLIVMLRSDVVSVTSGRKRVVLLAVSLFLDEPATGKRSKPMTIELDRLDRPTSEQDGKVVIAGLGRVEKVDLIVDAAREAVQRMREDAP